MNAPAPFQQFQQAFADHIRNPRQVPRPAGVPARRMRVYDELLYNNLVGFLDACFPVARQLLGPRRWARLTRRFFVAGEPRTPYFREIPKEFVDWFASPAQASAAAGLPPYLAELFRYEWAELAVDVMEAPAGAGGRAIDPTGDLLTARPVLNPALMVLACQWPVHRIGPGYRPRRPQPVHLVVLRDAECQVRFVEINAVTTHLLGLLQAGTLSGRAACLQVAEALSHPQPEQVVAFGAGLLAELRQAEILLGVWE